MDRTLWQAKEGQFPEVRPSLLLAFSSQQTQDCCIPVKLSIYARVTAPSTPGFDRMHLQKCIVSHRGAEIARGPTKLAG